MRGGMSAWLSHHFLWNWNLEMLVYEECRKTSGPWEKPDSNPHMALTLPDLNLGHAVGRQVFSPLHHPLLSSVPHQILACLCSPEILMQAISEKNQVPPTNTPPAPPPPPPVTDYEFFSSVSVQNVVGLRTKLHVNPDYNFSVLVDS